MNKRTEHNLIHECIHKRFYDSETAAYSAMVKLMIANGELDEQLHIYPCNFANHYHFGHTRSS